MTEGNGSSHPEAKKEYKPRLIFWEVTKGCNLRCIHCRATATELMSPRRSADRQSAEHHLARSPTSAIRSWCSAAASRCIAHDIFQLAEYATSRGLRTALATNGTLVTKDVAQKIKNSRHQARLHLAGRRRRRPPTIPSAAFPGAFDAAIYGMRNLQELGMSVQINTTIARHNAHQLPDVLDLARRPGRRRAAHLPAGAGGLRRGYRRRADGRRRKNTSAC